MRHSDINLTMGVYTDPKLLDVRGALDARPSLSLRSDQAGKVPIRATGTDGAARTVAPTVAPTADNWGPKLSHAVNPSTDGVPTTFAATGSPDKRKGPPSAADGGPSCRGEPRRTFVNEIIGLPLALSVLPETIEFPGDAVLELVEPGLYRKGHRVRRSTHTTPEGSQ
jgi:hypothetical protein